MPGDGDRYTHALRPLHVFFRGTHLVINGPFHDNHHVATPANRSV